VTIDADSLEPRQVVVDLLGADRKPDRLVAIDVRDIGGDTANGLTAHLARSEAAGLPDFRYGEGVSSLNKSTDLGEEAEDGDE